MIEPVTEMDPCHHDIGREGTKSEHVHVFASRVIAHTHVIVLGRTSSRDVWVVYILTYGLKWP